MIKNKRGWTLFYKSWVHSSDTFSSYFVIDSDSFGLGINIHRGDFTINVSIHLPFMYAFITWYIDKIKVD